MSENQNKILKNEEDYKSHNKSYAARTQEHQVKSLKTIFQKSVLFFYTRKLVRIQTWVGSSIVDPVWSALFIVLPNPDPDRLTIRMF